ncbi:MAG TPA: hypothetical protein VL068_00605 [Microthrixaceae bacterium]|nr:hypothetical protein [Microthrixaceae bacterium]
MAFAWAAGCPDGSVDLAYFEYLANPSAGTASQIGDSEFYSVAPDELCEQYIGRFELDPAKTDEELLSELLGRARATHPSSWPAVTSP